MSAQDLEPVAWITPESIRHLAKMNGPANVVVWNCASGNARVPLYAAPQPPQPAPVVDDARMARALEWVRTNAAFEFPHIREHLPAIEEAIAAYNPSCGARTVRGVDDAMRELIDAADKAKRAYWLARNSAAGLTNYCEESANSRRCERELDEAERIYRDSGFEAALARAQGVQS